MNIQTYSFNSEYQTYMTRQARHLNPIQIRKAITIAETLARDFKNHFYCIDAEFGNPVIAFHGNGTGLKEKRIKIKTVKSA